MSQRVVTLDDHSKEELPTENAAATMAIVNATRNGRTVTWDGANLSDESWNELIDTLTAFFPELTPTDTGELEADTDQDNDSTVDHENGTRGLRLIDAVASGTAAIATPAPKTADPKELSKLRRSWYYALSATELKRLDLPAPRDRTVKIGKLPEKVVATYNEIHGIN